MDPHDLDRVVGSPERQRHPEVMSQDLTVMTSRGWFPQTDIPELEELRERHETLIDQRDAKQAEAATVREGFAAEERAVQDELDAAYREGRDPKLPKRTSEPQRQQAIATAEGHATAAARAVVAFAYEALEKLRGDVPPDWHFHHAQQSGHVPPNGIAAAAIALVEGRANELQEQIDQARRTLTEAEQRLRGQIPLYHWLLRNGNGGSLQMVPGADMPVPEAYTVMNKPRDLHVEGWWDDDVNTGPLQDAAEEQPA